LVALAMNYDSTTGKTVNDFPRIQTGSAKEGFALRGFGAAGVEILDDLSPIIHRGLGQRFKQLVSTRSKTMNLAITRRPYAIQYTVPKMVVQKRHLQLEWLSNPETGTPHLEGLFLRSLTRQAETTGVSIPDGLEVSFLGAPGTFTAKRKTNQSLSALGLRDAVFSVNAKLEGLWSVGYLLSKGYGAFDANFQLGNFRGQS
jgi:hypothetical protein